MEEKIKELKELSKPLVEWLEKNGNPHTAILIEMDSIKILETTYGIPLEIGD